MLGEELTASPMLRTKNKRGVSPFKSPKVVEIHGGQDSGSRSKEQFKNREASGNEWPVNRTEMKQGWYLGSDRH